ncbi:MAG TPA: winged helix-turn-helix domain-containing protein [Terracidiphilus sp.]|nr:winged helix-turn-helix domain-containing protein [Terracidiphilus sp.]
MAAGTGILYEFGVYRVDPGRKLLLRGDQPVPVTPKVFEVLLILVRRSGEVVTKEELMCELWPDSFVEESNLSQNIFMLRKAIGDTSEERRHIVTVPGRGYRFVGDVRTVQQQGESILIATHTRSQLLVEQTERQIEVSAPTLSRARKFKAWQVYAGATALIIGGVVAAWFLSQRRNHPAILKENDPVFIGDFSNTTGDGVFDETLRQGLVVQLEQSPFLSLIPENRIRHTLELMGQPADKPLGADQAREACVRAGGVALLDGSIARLDSQYVIGLRAVDCQNGATLDMEQDQTARKEDVLNALSQIAVRFRSRVGESLATIQEHETPLADATTPSLEALKAYSIGHRLISTTGAEHALPFFQRAVSIDPNFAMAYALLGRAYADLSQDELSAKYTAMAYQLRDRTSDAEKFWIEAAYEMQVTENMERAQQVCEVWERTYPHDVTPATFLAGIIYPVFGRWDQAVEEARKALDVDPDFLVTFAVLSGAYESRGSLQDAENTFKQAEARNVEIPEVLLARYDVAFLRGDEKEMDHVTQLASGNQPVEEWVTQHTASVLAYRGQVQKARRAAENAETFAQQAGNTEAAALYKAGTAIWEGLFGNRSEAERSADAALKLSTNRGVEYGAAIALALSGQPVRAQRLADNLDKRFPEDTSVQCSYLPSLRGQIALDRGNPTQALELLQKAVPCEIGTPRTAIHANFGAMYPTFVRGEALLALKKGSEAAREFEKIADHPGVVVSDPIGALARLELGRADAIAGNQEKARYQYEGFLSLWKSADPDIPLLTQAKKEQLSLQCCASH